MVPKGIIFTLKFTYDDAFFHIFNHDKIRTTKFVNDVAQEAFSIFNQPSFLPMLTWSIDSIQYMNSSVTATDLCTSSPKIAKFLSQQSDNVVPWIIISGLSSHMAGQWLC